MGPIKMADRLRLPPSNTIIGNLAVLIEGSNPSGPNHKKITVEIVHKKDVRHYDEFLKIEYSPQKIILGNIDKIRYYKENVALFDREKNITYAYTLEQLTIKCRIKLFIEWLML